LAGEAKDSSRFSVYSNKDEKEKSGRIRTSTAGSAAGTKLYSRASKRKTVSALSNKSKAEEAQKLATSSPAKKSGADKSEVLPDSFLKSKSTA